MPTFQGISTSAGIGAGQSPAKSHTLNKTMIVIREPSTALQISNVAIRELVQHRIDALHGDGFDLADIGYFLVVEPGDTIEAINVQAGFPILCNHLTDKRWDQPTFTPSFELVEEFPACYCIVFVLGQDGAGIELFVPKTEGVEPDLLAMCRRYAMLRAT